MRVSTLIFSVLLIALYSYASATIINIPADYPAIQQGIDASTDGDTVLVQPGTYVENINFNGHNIVLGSLFLTTGDTSYISQTVIDGDSAGTVVTFGNSEDSTAILTGFTIQNGYTAGMHGGGIHCVDSRPTISNNIITHNFFIGIHCFTSSNATIINNTIIQNSADGIFCWDSNPMISNNIISGNSGGVGGGISCRYSSPTITSNTISGNLANLGGGIYCHTSSPTITDNIIAENSAGDDGCGGIWCDNHSNPTITNNTINGNSGTVGGIFCWDSNPMISNNIISGNSGSIGGGINCYNSNPIISNNVINENSAIVSGGGIYCESVSNPVIVNTILWANSAQYYQEIWADTSSSLTITYCNIQDTLWPGIGNIDTNPLFRDPANGDFHLMSIACGDSADSPCIDAGDPNILDSLLDCSWGLGGLRSDIGAYGGGDSAMTAIFEAYIPTPGRFALMQNYPNPFNPTTTISFSLPEPSEISLTIYNMLGQKVATLFEGIKQAGMYTITWNASDFPSGIYFARLESGESSKNIKMLLIK